MSTATEARSATDPCRQSTEPKPGKPIRSPDHSGPWVTPEQTSLLQPTVGDAGSENRQEKHHMRHDQPMQEQANRPPQEMGKTVNKPHKRRIAQTHTRAKGDKGDTAPDRLELKHIERPC